MCSADEHTVQLDGYPMSNEHLRTNLRPDPIDTLNLHRQPAGAAEIDDLRCLLSL
jgi:hypothetical protein